MKLFDVTIKRTYTKLGVDTWGKKEELTTTPMWAESLEQLKNKVNNSLKNQSKYWLERFKDSLHKIIELDVVEQRNKIHAVDKARVCCNLAVYFYPCVCMVSFTCPTHGEKHIGTHD